MSFFCTIWFTITSSSHILSLKYSFILSSGSYDLRKIFINSSRISQRSLRKNIFFFNSVLCFNIQRAERLSNSRLIELICSSKSRDKSRIWNPVLFPDSYSKKNFSSNLARDFDQNIFDRSNDFMQVKWLSTRLKCTNIPRKIKYFLIKILKYRIIYL